MSERNMSMRREKMRWRKALSLALPVALAASVTIISLAGSAPAREETSGEKVLSEEIISEVTSGEKVLSEATFSENALSEETSGEQASGIGQTPADIPSYYNLAKMGKKPTVRSQGNTGTCWAISSVSALESDLLPDTRLEFSADHMSLNNGFTLTQEDGGDYYMIMSYLADWKGPVLEEEDPYGDGESPDGLSAAIHVQEVRMLRGMDREEIKQMILQYGAAQSSLCLNRERTDTDDYHYYNAKTCSYFDPLMEDVDHDILILGWDDSFPRENFRIQPPEDGAWICQNTWGESFGEDGIFYVSYEDRNLFRRGGVVYNRIEGIDNYDHVYENDSLGWQGRQGYSKDCCWFAGAYTVSSEEMLSAAGIYSCGPDTDCRIYVIPDFTGEDDLKALADKAADETYQAAQAHFDTAGYYTVDLEEEIPLEAGQQFAVAVWIETPDEQRPVAVEMIKDRYTQTVTLDGRQTWISPDARRWESTQENYQTNACLKIYTRDIEES